MPTATKPNPTLQIIAHRLVHMRNCPFNKVSGRELTASEAFEYALRIVLDEYGVIPGSDTWCALFYGKPQSSVTEMPNGWV